MLRQSELGREELATIFYDTYSVCVNEDVFSEIGVASSRAAVRCAASRPNKNKRRPRRRACGFLFTRLGLHIRYSVTRSDDPRETTSASE